MLDGARAKKPETGAASGGVTKTMTMDATMAMAEAPSGAAVGTDGGGDKNDAKNASEALDIGASPACPTPSLTCTQTSTSTDGSNNDDNNIILADLTTAPATTSPAPEDDDGAVKEVDVKIIYDNPGRPLKDRQETVRMVEALVGKKIVVEERATKNTKKGNTSKKNSKKSRTNNSSEGEELVGNISIECEADNDEDEVGIDDGMKPRSGCSVQRRPPLSNVYGDGPFLLSDVPPACLNDNEGGGKGVVMGIDEAGRGSVLGPMVYGAAYWHASDGDRIPKDFNDSKQLGENQREALFEKILHQQQDQQPASAPTSRSSSSAPTARPVIGFAVRVLHASEISRCMLRNYNLNQMSHGAARDIIQHVLDAGVRVEKCYVDTVGRAETYQRWLEGHFPGIQFTVESKADAKYAPCSAASVGTCISLCLPGILLLQN